MALDFPASPTTGQTFNSGGQVWTYDGQGWVSAYQASGAVRASFTASASQTSFTVTGGYLPNLIDVYQNGVKLINGTDVTVTSGTTVNLTVGATAGDIIEVLGLSSFAVSNYLPLAGGTMSGNLIHATGANILGDFSNSTLLSRSNFQTSTVNGTTGIYALPSGTGTAASWQATNAADPTNASKILIATNGSTDVQLVSGRNGTGTYLPLSFYTNNTQQLQLSTAGILTGTAGNLMLIQGTAQNSTSGTSIDFTSIPSWVKRITVMFNGVSVSGTSSVLVQIGTGGVPTTSGYVSSSAEVYSASGIISSTAGFLIYVNNAGYLTSGIITLANVSGNIWVASGTLANTAVVPFVVSSGGTVSLAGILNMLRITTVNGTDTFDAGSVNIMYE